MDDIRWGGHDYGDGPERHLLITNEGTSHTEPTEPARDAFEGNISQSTGEKIYRVPGGEFYDQTVIDPASGERWFCTVAEAVANGWRKSPR